MVKRTKISKAKGARGNEHSPAAAAAFKDPRNNKSAKFTAGIPLTQRSTRKK